MEVSIHDIHELLKKGKKLVFLDIRENREIQTGYIEGALFVPYDSLENKVEELIPDKDAHIVTYCAFGIKSVDAVRVLRRMGYKNAFSMKEGFEGWRAQGYDIASDSTLSEEQLTRYSRHVLLGEIGLEGQRKLLSSEVLIVGAGGLGSPSALYLAAAGIGTLGIIDHDCVDLSNLQRQIIHGTDDVGRPKVESAKRSLRRINPDVEVITYKERLGEDNVLDILKGYDVVLDGSDNFPTKFLINDACFFLGIPDVFGGVFQFEGQVSVFDPSKDAPCLRCVFPEPPPQGLLPSCSVVGVLGVVPGQIGLLQALETIKLLLQIGEPLIGRFLVFDALTATFHSFLANKNPLCPLCGEKPSIRSIEEYKDSCSLK